MDERGMGVIKKNTHIFSSNRPFARDMAMTMLAAPWSDSREATNSKTDRFFHLLGIGESTVLEGFLYIHE